MLEAVLLNTSRSESAVEGQVRVWSTLLQATHVPTATSIVTSTSVPPASLFFFLGGRLVQTHLQAERRTHVASVRLPIGSEHFGQPRTRKGEAELKRRSTALEQFLFT